MKRRKQDLPFNLIKYIVRRAPWVQKYALHNWGEPLLYSQILDVIQHLKDRGKNVHFNTNGLLIREYGRSILDLGVDSLSFSVDGTGINYAAIRNFPYKQIRSNIFWFMDLAHKKRSEIDISITATVGPLNVLNIPKLKRDWAGILRIQLQPQTTFQYKRRYKPCSELTSQQVIILSNGHVVPCCSDYEGDLSIGNVKHKALEKILETPFSDIAGRCNYCAEYENKYVGSRFKPHPIKSFLRAARNRARKIIKF